MISTMVLAMAILGTTPPEQAAGTGQAVDASVPPAVKAISKHSSFGIELTESAQTLGVTVRWTGLNAPCLLCINLEACDATGEPFLGASELPVPFSGLVFGVSIEAADGTLSLSFAQSGLRELESEHVLITVQSTKSLLRTLKERPVPEAGRTTGKVISASTIDSTSFAAMTPFWIAPSQTACERTMPQVASLAVRQPSADMIVEAIVPQRPTALLARPIVVDRIAK
jgi:hypothetical protein